MNDKKRLLEKNGAYEKLEESSSRKLLKYFLHGILFSIIFLVLAFVWIAILALLVTVGGFIGLAIGFAVLFFIVGSLNSILVKEIWGISTKTAWTNLIGHGFALFAVLIILNIPTMFARLFIPDLTVTIVLFLIETFIGGFVAKNVARFWKKPISIHDASKQAGQTSKAFLKKCVGCGREIPIASEECSNCGAQQLGITLSATVFNGTARQRIEMPTQLRMYTQP